VLVNNSGTTWGEPFEKYEEKGWDKGMSAGERRREEKRREEKRREEKRREEKRREER
jgi:hypothetical protein